jgi:ligand-binding sensor domain-containing protein
MNYRIVPTTITPINYTMKSILNPTVSDASSSHFDFVHINNENGLSSEEIRCVYQDKEGYMWFATHDGLNRFDGYVTKVYKMRAHITSFSVSSFESICEDSQERLWLGSTSKGVLIFDKRNESFYTFNEFSKDMHLGKISIRTIKYDGKGCIWVGTEDGLYSYDIDKDDLIHYKLAGISGSEEKCIVEDIMQDKQGNMWIATWSEGLLLYQKDSGQFKHFGGFDRIEKDEKSNRIRSLFQDEMGFIWVGTWENGLYKTSYNDDKFIIEKVFISDELNPETISGNIIYDINQDNNGNLWIGTPLWCKHN